MEPFEIIRTLRNETGLSRKDFAENLGIPLRTMEDWEAGRRKPPEYVLRLLMYQVRLQVHQIQNNKKDRNIDIITDVNGNKIVMINDKIFRGQDKNDWEEVEEYLMQFVGECYEIEASSEIIYIGKDFPDEFSNSKQRISLKGANRKAKANAAQGIPELIKIAVDPVYEANKESKHDQDAKYGWYRYWVRFGIPVFDDKTDEIVRYNIFKARMLVRYSEDGNKYLYDFLTIKKENEQPV